MLHCGVPMSGLLVYTLATICVSQGASYTAPEGCSMPRAPTEPCPASLFQVIIYLAFKVWLPPAS